MASSRSLIERLSAIRHVIVPAHPGFAGSNRPKWLDTVRDIAVIYLDLLDHYQIPRIEIIGLSLGGWIAAEIASMVPERVKKLILTCPMGIKVGPVGQLDIPDVFAMSPKQLETAMFADTQNLHRYVANLADGDLGDIVRGREVLALVGWEPYMHDPKLRFRPGRIRCPTLFIRGSQDGIISRTYLEAYSNLVAGSSLCEIENAGHMIEIEQCDRLLDTIARFLE